MAISLWHGHCRHAERLWLHGRAAVASRAARFAGIAAACRRLAPQTATQIDCNVANVSAIELLSRGCGKARCRYAITVAVSSPATERGGNPRHHLVYHR